MSKTVNDLIGAHLPFARGFKETNIRAIVDGGTTAATAREGADGINRRIGNNDAGYLSLQLRHGLKRDVLRRFRRAHQHACILLGEEPFRSQTVEPDGRAKSSDGHQ